MVFHPSDQLLHSPFQGLEFCILFADATQYLVLATQI